MLAGLKREARACRDAKGEEEGFKFLDRIREGTARRTVVVLVVWTREEKDRLKHWWWRVQVGD